MSPVLRVNCAPLASLRLRSDENKGHKIRKVTWKHLRAREES